jgi:hypothetical protein
MIVDLNEERRKKQRGDRWDRWFAILEQDALIETKSRAFRALWIEYQDASAGRKREILLSLREQYRALPTHIQEELWQELYRWLDDFEEEEVRCGERAESDRRYVWTFYVRERWA